MSLLLNLSFDVTKGFFSSLSFLLWYSEGSKKHVHFCFYAWTNNKDTLKIFSHIRLCRAFFADHFGKKTFFISLRNDVIIVKILNTVQYRLPQCVCNLVCFVNISAQTNDKIFFFQKRRREKLYNICKNKSLLTCCDGFF